MMSTPLTSSGRRVTSTGIGGRVRDDTEQILAHRTFENRSSSNFVSSRSQLKSKVADDLRTCAKMPSNDASALSKDNGSTVQEAAQLDRKVRYKEERRKQLANQFGQWSEDKSNAALPARDGSPKLGEEPSYMRYSRRHQKCPPAVGNDKDLTSSPVITRRSDLGSSVAWREDDKLDGDPLSANKEGGAVRSNKASRLRAIAKGTPQTPELPVRQSSFRSRLLAGRDQSSSASTMMSRSDSSSHANVIEAAPGVSLSPGSALRSRRVGEGETNSESSSQQQQQQQQHLHGRPKNKSSKRKSNLNRGILPADDVSCGLAGESSRQQQQQALGHHQAASSCISTQGGGDDVLLSGRIVCKANKQLLEAARILEDSAHLGLEKTGLKSTSASAAALQRPAIPEIFKHRRPSNDGLLSRQDRGLSETLTISSQVPKVGKEDVTTFGYQDYRHLDYIDFDRCPKMGGRQAKMEVQRPASMVDDTDIVFYSKVSVSTKLTPGYEPLDVVVASGKPLAGKRTTSQYAPDGNWQLRDNKQEDGDVQRPVVGRGALAYHLGRGCVNSSAVAPTWQKDLNDAPDEPSSILKRTNVDETAELSSKSILKVDSSWTTTTTTATVDDRPPFPHSILKRASTVDTGSSDQAIRRPSLDKCSASILKKWDQSETASATATVDKSNLASVEGQLLTSILRRKSSSEDAEGFSSVEDLPHSILRRKSSATDVEASEDLMLTHSILKKHSSSVDDSSSLECPRPILKKKLMSAEEHHHFGFLEGGGGGDPKPILKRYSADSDVDPSLMADGLKPILKLSRRCSEPPPCEHLLSTSSASVQNQLSILRLHGHGLRQETVQVPPQPAAACALGLLPLMRTSNRARYSTVTTSSDDEFVSLPSSPVFVANGHHSCPASASSTARSDFTAGSAIDWLEGKDDDHQARPSTLYWDCLNSSPPAIDSTSLPSDKRFESAKDRDVLAEASSVEPGAVLDPPPAISSVVNLRRPTAVHNRRLDRDPNRYKTQPVTFAELYGTVGREPQMSGPDGLSKDDGQQAVEKATNSSSEDEVLRLSVADKALLFMRKQSQERTSAVQERFHRNAASRRHLPRSQTQPVTVEEVHEAAKMADKTAGSTSESENEPSKLSLADRVRLFNRKVVEEVLPPRKVPIVATDQSLATFSSAAIKKPVPCNDDLVNAKSHNAENKHPDGILKSQHNQRPPPSTSPPSKTSVTHKHGFRSVSFLKCSASHGHLSADHRSPEANQTAETTARTKSPPSSGSSSSASSSSSSDEGETEGVMISVRDERGQTSSTSSANACNEASLDNTLVFSQALQSEQRLEVIRNEAAARQRNVVLKKLDQRKEELRHMTHQNLTSKSSQSTVTTLTSRQLQVQRHAVIESSATMSSSSSPSVTCNAVETDVKVGKILDLQAVDIGPRRMAIKDRLAALQKSQSEDWKQRLERVKTVDMSIGDASRDCKGDSSVDEVDNSQRLALPQDVSSPKILSRVTLLESSQNEWRKRVEEKDATKFTVAGKLGSKNLSKVADRELLLPPPSPDVGGLKKRIPKPVRFQSKTANILDLKGNDSSARGSSVGGLSRSRSMPMPRAPVDINQESPEKKNPLARVMVPKLDDEDFSSFFHATDVASIQSQRLQDIDDDDFDRITCESHQLVVQRRTVQATRRHVSARNPLRALATRSDLVQDEYSEVMTGVAETELKRLKVEQLAKHSDLATSALAGLVSTEDFKSVSLCRNSSMSNLHFAPHKDLMLLHVKGRRHVQTRLVEPKVTSLNKGDNFVLVTPNEVYNFIGEFSNVIERAKGAEVALVVQSRKELGCKGSSDVVIFDEEKRNKSRDQWRAFCQLLGGEDVILEPANAEEDELFETAIVGTNKVYTVEESELVPYEQYWGSLPRIEMLEHSKVLVFDFGTEMYVWQGKLASPELRKRAIRLAKELFDEGYDYTECDINPLNPLQQNEAPANAKKRPSWTLFAKINEHMETVLFREKFVDWPDMKRLIRVKREDSIKSESSFDLQPCDAKQMFEGLTNVEPDLVLEGSHLGRGLVYWEEEESRCSEVITLGIKVWHVLEYNHNILPIESWGQFHSEDTYVVRWQYRVSIAGRRLTGQASKHATLGRERCAYFFWQGNDSTVNEKGASALMTVELDEERGPHVRVVQGQEPPSFLNLFKGGMIVHQGKRGDIPSETWRLFVVRGDYENEAHLTELRFGIRSLRSRGIYILLNRTTGALHLWTGSKASADHMEAARATVSLIHDRKPLELGIKFGVTVTVQEEMEGSESEAFWNVFGRNLTGSPYLSLLSDGRAYDFTPRLFHMTSILGVFSASEVICSFNCTKRTCTFPFLQQDLYKCEQPALFLLDNQSEVYIWQGWWPESTDDNDNMATGSAHLRFNVERRFAMETALEYCELKEAQCSTAYAVWAGSEPPEFQNIFPYWESVKGVLAAAADGSQKDDEKRLVSQVLRQLKTTRYTYAELQARPLPEGVDPSILESYLSNDDFECVLKMTKKQFYALPQWKQYNLKKTVGLFY